MIESFCEKSDSSTVFLKNIAENIKLNVDPLTLKKLAMLVAIVLS
jgi:hypothetical protein